MRPIYSTSWTLFAALFLLPGLTAGQTWSSPVAVTFDASDTVSNSQPAVAANAAGTVLCWTSYSFHGGSLVDADILYSFDSTGTWTSPRVVVADPRYFDYFPSVTIAHASTPLAVWSRSSAPMSDSVNLCWSEYRQGWSEPLRVPTGAGTPRVGTGSVFADRDGRTWVAWVQHDSALGFVRACAVYRQDAVWSSVQVVSRAPELAGNFQDGLSMVQCSDGRIWAAWKASYSGEPYTVYTSYFDGVRWSHPVACHPMGSSDDLNGTLTADSLGRLWVFWGQWDGTWSARHDSDGWTDQMRVEGRPAVEASPCSDSRGRLWLVWDGGLEGAYDVLSKMRDSSGWHGSVPVDTTPATDYSPVVVPGQRGMWAVWTRVPDGGSGRTNIYASYSDVSGIEDRTRVRRPGPSRSSCLNPARGCVVVRASEPVVLLDEVGRRVMSLQPGNNDIRSVSPGIYFIRREEDNSTTKVVVQK